LLDSFKKEVEAKHDYLIELIKEHKTQVDEKIASKSRRFSNKQIEKQFQVNFAFRELVTGIQQALAIKDWEKAEELAEELAEKLEQHEQDLIIADTSPHGWLTVSKLRNSTELPKAVWKRLDVIEKELATKKQKYGGPRRNFKQFSAAGQDGFAKSRKYSPEEALFAASKQVRAGTCSHCHKEYHYYRECPSFWSKVQESRAAKAKGSATATSGD
jgi:Zn-dependent M16 (insulinase) family peptidase